MRAAISYGASRYEVINSGNTRTVRLIELVRELREVLGVEAKLGPQPEQPGDVPRTFADIGKARGLLGYQPCTRFRKGLRCFAQSLREQPGVLTNPSRHQDRRCQGPA